jgi:hypothetical protein
MGLQNGPFNYLVNYENILNELEFNIVQWRKYKFSNHLLTHWLISKSSEDDLPA